MTSLYNIIMDAVREVLTKFAGFLPALVGSIIVLVIGWIFAKVIREMIQKYLKVIDTIADKAGVSSILDKSGLKMSASHMLGALFYWLIIVMALVGAVNALGLTVASQLLERLFAYIPSVISAVFVLVLGTFLANFVSGTVYTMANNANIPHPEILAKICRWAIVVFAVTIVFEELGVAPLLVGTTFNILFGAVCFGLALAFGLGGKDAAARYIEELRKRR